MSKNINSLKKRLKGIENEANNAYVTYKEKLNAANWLRGQIQNFEADVTRRGLKPFISKYWKFSHKSSDWQEELVMFVKNVEVDTEGVYVSGIGVYVEYGNNGKTNTVTLKDSAYFSTSDVNAEESLEWRVLNLRNAQPSTKEEFLDMVAKATERFLSDHKDLTKD